MRVLSIDTATESATCAVLDEDKLLGEITFNNERQHSVILMTMIDNLLSSLHLEISDIDGFISSKGPGSFTGLRIGMATIKGLCFGAQKPFVSVSSLDALAFNMTYFSGIICPILDALRDNIYTALYTFDGEDMKRISEYMIISIDELTDMVSDKGQICFIGDGTYKFKDKIKSRVKDCFFAPRHLNLVRASSLGELGIKLLRDGVYEDINTSTPVYLRKSQAEREYDKKMELNKNE